MGPGSAPICARPRCRGPRAEDHVRGPEDAPLVIEYADFECPYCAALSVRLDAAAAAPRVPPFPGSLEPSARVAGGVRRRGGRLQGRFWEMHDLLFADQGRLEDPHLWDRARQPRARPRPLRRRPPQRGGQGAREARLQSGVRGGVVTTPTLFSARPDVHRRHRRGHARGAQRLETSCQRSTRLQSSSSVRRRRFVTGDQLRGGSAPRARSPAGAARTPTRAGALRLCSGRRGPWRSHRRSRARARRRRPARVRARVGPAEAIEDPRRAPRRHTRALVLAPRSTSCPRRAARARSSIAACSRVYLTAFSSSASSAARSRSGSTRSRPARKRSEPPGARRDLRPAHEHVLEEGLDSISREVQEVGLVGGREQQQALDDRVDPRELVERDVELRRLRVLGGISSRWPRAIVTGVRSSCEASWMKRSWRSSSERRSSARPSAIRCASTRRRACHTIGEEHRRHQRNLEQLSPELDPVERVEDLIDAWTGQHHHADQDEQRRPRSGQTRKP